MDIKSIFKKTLPHLLAIVAMLIVSSAYFYPALEGKTLQGTDVTMNYGKFRERFDFQEYENEYTMWNGAMFSGMPEFISAKYEGGINLYHIWNIPSKLGLPLEIVSLFWYMIGFYIMLLAFGVSPLTALLGSVGFGLTTYNLIIIEAGHYMKVHTVAFIPPTLGGIYLVLRKKYALGFIVTAFFLALQINMKHIQMMYYFLIVLLIIAITEAYYWIKQKEYKDIFKISSVLFLAGTLALTINFAKLSNLYKYSNQSIRGKNELTVNSSAGTTSSGLDKDYINAWSSGRSESMMIFSSNAKGGKTGLIKQNREQLKKVPASQRGIIGNMNQYWGDQKPFSGGPNYIGAAYFFLFLLGLALVKDRIKIGILIATILLVLLSWGGNFSVFTDFFIDYVPMYNKFRTPVSILAIVAILIPLIAVLTVHEVSNSDNILGTKNKVPFLKKPQPTVYAISVGFLGFLLLNILFPSLLNQFITDDEFAQFQSIIQQQNAAAQVNQLMQNLTDYRASVFRADMWRTFLFCSAVLVFIVLFSKKRIKKQTFITLVLITAIVDLIGIGLRYVDHDMFNNKEMVKKTYAINAVDNQIYQMEMSQNQTIKDDFQQLKASFNPNNEQDELELLRHAVAKNTHFRVFNLTLGPFQETNTTNAHRSIGGYHAVKLRRYQDLIEHHIAKNNMNVINMLDTKYYITQQGLQVNPRALGAAWFVDSIKWASTPDEEIQELTSLDPKKEVIINKKHEALVKEFEPATTNDAIEFIKYNPERLTYKSNTTSPKMAVFSEVYYPGWELLIDGEEADFFQVNYTLRGALIPEGEHDIEFVFNPKFYTLSNKVSQIAFYIFILVIISVAFFAYKQEQKKAKVH